MANFIIEQNNGINFSKYEVSGHTAKDAMEHLFNCKYEVENIDSNFSEYICREEGSTEIFGFDVINIYDLNQYQIKKPSSVTIKYYVENEGKRHLILQTENLGVTTSYLKYLFDKEKRYVQAQKKFEHHEYRNDSGTQIHFAYKLVSRDKKIEVFEDVFTI